MSNIKNLFADGPVKPKPEPRPKQKADDRSLEGWARVILKPHTPAQAGVPPCASRETVEGVRGVFAVQKLGHEGEMAPEDKMLAYDRMLFEGLFLRYGRKWVNEQMAQLLRRFPSYRKDD